LDLALGFLELGSELLGLPLLPLELRLTLLLFGRLLMMILGLPILSLLTTLKLLLSSLSTSFRRESGLSLSEPHV
jgi:hypothetical protein